MTSQVDGILEDKPEGVTCLFTEDDWRVWEEINSRAKKIIKVRPKPPKRIQPPRYLLVCKCGHGEVHHNQKLGKCSCPIRYKYDLCKCLKFDLDWCLMNGVKMTAEEFKILKGIEQIV